MMTEPEIRVLRAAAGSLRGEVNVMARDGHDHRLADAMRSLATRGMLVGFRSRSDWVLNKWSVATLHTVYTATITEAGRRALGREA